MMVWCPCGFVKLYIIILLNIKCKYIGLDIHHHRVCEMRDVVMLVYLTCVLLLWFREIYIKVNVLLVWSTVVIGCCEMSDVVMLLYLRPPCVLLAFAVGVAQ